METRGPESSWKVLKDYGLAVVLAVLIAVLIRSVGIEAYRIPGSSMQPTLLPGDTVFVSKSAYGFRLPGVGWLTGAPRSPERGDVIVFSPMAETGQDRVRRVVAIAGDRVAIQGGRLWVNGKSVAAPRLGQGGPESCEWGQPARESLPNPGGASQDYFICQGSPALPRQEALEVPAGSVFVLADQRQGHSELSGPKAQVALGIGLVSLEAIRGKVLWIWLSIRPRPLAEPLQESQPEKEQSDSQDGWLSRVRFGRIFQKI